MAWVPLHVHSQYSVLRSTASIEKLVTRSKELGCFSLALTDQGNMFGAVEFYKECRSQGIQPIIGCELHVAPFSRQDKKRIPGYSSGYPLTLLVKNNQGYKNLCKLTSFAHLEGFYYTPRVDKELLNSFSEGLICLSGPIQGRVGSLILEGKEEELSSEIAWLQSLFKEDFYLEVQRHRMSPEILAESSIVQEGWLHQKYQEFVQNQEIVSSRLKDLSKERGIPCVATPDIQYLYPDDWKAHEILINIQSGEPCEVWDMDSAGNRKALVLNPKRDVLYSQRFYFPTEAEMREQFFDMPESVDITCEIANKCAFDFDFKTKYYPVFVPPHMEGTIYDSVEREKEAAQFLRDLCKSSVSTRYPEEALESIRVKYPDKDPQEMVQSRLDYELDIITSKGMVDYLLIVYDFIAWAKKSRIPMGPGRGSGAGSIILYLIGITDIEPLRFSLFFERFINPERISYPDIDVDICMERRQEVIDYTVQKYGKDRVAQIITFGTMKAKMAVKDVGRVLSVPLAKVNALAKLIPEDPNMTLEKALEIDPDLKAQYESDAEVNKLITIALKLEGSVRNTGIHAAGLIIGGQALMENIPLCSPKDSEMAVTQFSMKPVESVGLLKIDFLGLKTLSSIQRAVDAVQENKGITIPWVNLPLDDQATFNLLNQGKTQGVFQLESGGMQELAKQLHIDKFEEIIAVGALYRPGPMEMIPSFIQRKHGKEAIEMDHPFMTDILSETYGIMVYQEQVMQIASRLANYSLGEGDVLRRAMGKKDREEMSKQREKFKQGALQNQIDESTSMQIFDKIEKFASYGFNKSHAAAYGYLSYVTAYLKANYPMEWMAALMTSDRDDITKVAKLIRESRASGISVLPPDVNESGKDFVATSQGIRFAMGGIKGVGEGVVDVILEERAKAGPFKSLYNFVQRIETKKVGKKVIESLIEAGCFDGTGWSRAALIDSLEPIFSAVARNQKERAQGFLDLFSALEENTEQNSFEVPPKISRMISKQQTLYREYELLGFYLREHPLDEFKPLFPKLSCRPLHELSSLDKMAVCRTAFIIETVSIKISGKTQKKFAILVVSDGLETLEVSVWPEVYEQVNSLLVENQLIYAVLVVDQQEDGMKLQARWLGALTRVDEEMIKTCDEMYEKGLAYLKIAQLKEKRPSSTKEKNVVAKEKSEGETVQKLAALNSVIELSVDLDKAHLSHILALKKLFRSHAGQNSIILHFFSQQNIFSSVRIESEWGVNWDGILQEKLESFPCIFAVKK